MNKAQMEPHVSIEAAQTEANRLVAREDPRSLSQGRLPVDTVKERSTKLEARKKELPAASTRRNHLPCSTPIWQNIIMRPSVLSGQLAMKKRGHLPPIHSARWSAASISCPMVRNG